MKPINNKESIKYAITHNSITESLNVLNRDKTHIPRQCFIYLLHKSFCRIIFQRVKNKVSQKQNTVLKIIF